MWEERAGCPIRALAQDRDRRYYLGYTIGPIRFITLFFVSYIIMPGGDKAKAEAQRLRDHKGGFLGSIFGAGRGKQEEAGELYTKAGNAFKFEKNWDQAAECFTEAAKCFIKAEGSTNDACTSFVEAANACKQVILFHRSSIFECLYIYT